MNDEIKALLNHLLRTYKKSTLVSLFGISDATWRQHKAYVDTGGKSGTKLSSKHYSNIKRKYIEYLNDKLREVKDLDVQQS